MNMSEFERQNSEDDLSRFLMYQEKFPADFSAEDMAFSQELDGLFDISQENMPPYFSQTLLEPDSQRAQAVEDAFVPRIRVHVLRRLNIRRRLFRSSPFKFPTVMSKHAARRPFFASFMVLIAVMVLTMLYTAPSFASGLALLLAGPHAGIVQVHNLPKGGSVAPVLHSTDISNDLPGNLIGLGDAQSLLQFPMYFPQNDALPNNYTLRDIYIYQGAEQSWAVGPIMEVDYASSSMGLMPHSIGSLVICEFRPAGKVLQIVGYGAAHKLEIDPAGKVSGVYVDGQWAQKSHEWTFGSRSELIYERDGIVFWILGFQRDGVTGNAMSKVASSLEVYSVDPRSARNIIQSPDDAPPLLKGQVIYLDNPDDPNGLMLKVVGS